MAARDRRLRVLMLPWLAHGHITPFLELAMKLVERNFYVYFCSTPVNLTSSVENRVTDKYHQSIELVELHLQPSPEFPPHYHTCNGLPPNLLSTITCAFKNAAPAISNIVETIHPDLVIYDFMSQLLIPEISSIYLNIPTVLFLTSGAAMFALVTHMRKCQGKAFPFPEIHLKKFDSLLPRNLVYSPNDSRSTISDYLGSLGRYGNIVLSSTCREMEGKYLDYLGSLLGKKIVPIGPIFRAESIIEKDEDNEIIRWLDKKGESSTVYVAFGSEGFLTKEEITEIACGLELSNANFVWVFRFHKEEKITVEEALPEGFLERVGERGMVVKGWAPQARILAHPSIGGFVSHCGMNSIIESMVFGVPIIGMPIQVDQPINARVMVEVGMGVEVDKDDNGVFPREEIAKVITKVVFETNGEYFRAKAREWSEKLKSKGEEEMVGAVEDLLQLCGEKEK